MKRYIYVLVLVVICAAASCAKTENAGYRTVSAYGDCFIAAGCGRFDILSEDGAEELLKENEKADFSDISVNDDTAAAVSPEGTVAVYDGKLTIYKGKKPLYCVCAYGDEWLAGSKRGRLMKTEDFKSWETEKLPTNGSIISIAARDNIIAAVTDKGELLVSSGGEWTAVDYKESYGKRINLYGIEAVNDMFWAYGAFENGDAAIIMSQAGGVWSERDLTVWGDNNAVTASDMEIAGICCDGEQKIAALADGRALILTDCVECNKIEQLADFTPSAAACNGKDVIAVGENYKYARNGVNEIRQDEIKSEAAYIMQQNGAYIIDVRTREEYDEKHIAGSVRIDSDKVKEQLPEICPDKNHEIIFYCASGVRSERALETAKSMGYKNVYNLGGIDNWQYGFVQD